MKRFKTTLYAMALLLAYLPAVLLSSLHTHTPVAQEPVHCFDCVHHQHHSGHLTTTFGHHDCMLCQFSQQTYIGNHTNVPKTLLLPTVVPYACETVGIQTAVQPTKSPRAPPLF
ncbi:MAG: hypothetical protein J5605_03415 [Bacteroidales bacterium]|nr:hypothetical protein [Bacteroidales bacterium]